MTKTTIEVAVCSFCGKHQHEVAALVAGPACFICDECVDLCDAICTAKRRGWPVPDCRSDRGRG